MTPCSWTEYYGSSFTVSLPVRKNGRITHAPPGVRLPANRVACKHATRPPIMWSLLISSRLVSSSSRRPIAHMSRQKPHANYTASIRRRPTAWSIRCCALPLQSVGRFALLALVLCSRWSTDLTIFFPISRVAVEISSSDSHMLCVCVCVTARCDEAAMAFDPRTNEKSQNYCDTDRSRDAAIPTSVSWDMMETLDWILVPTYPWDPIRCRFKRGDGD